MNQQNTISPALLLQVKDFVNTHTGLHFPDKRLMDLVRGITNAAPEFGFADAETCAQWLISTPLSRTQIETLADYLTIGETYFFREKKALEALYLNIIPSIISRQQNNTRYLRIWSAGCCTGEEPYSIAILLDKYFPQLAEWKVTILATDINPRFLQKARLGMYRDWSFRNTPDWVKNHYFTQLDTGEYQLLDLIKKQVTFTSLNLINDTYPSFLTDTTTLDIIICRNVLIYFDVNSIKTVVDRFYRALNTPGWLIVGSSETSIQYYTQFSAVKFPGVIVYQKELPVNQPAIPAGISPTVPLLKLLTPLALPNNTNNHADKPETLYQNALTLFKQKKYLEAINILQPLLTNTNSLTSSTIAHPSDAFSIIIKAYANQGLLAEARQWSEKAIAADKLNPVYYYLLGNILQEQQNFTAAIEAFKKVLYLEPNFTLAMIAIGNLIDQQGNPHEATRHFNNALLVLKNMPPETILFGSDSTTAGEVTEMLQEISQQTTFRTGK